MEGVHTYKIKEVKAPHGRHYVDNKEWPVHEVIQTGPSGSRIIGGYPSKTEADLMIKRMIRDEEVRLEKDGPIGRMG